MDLDGQEYFIRAAGLTTHDPPERVVTSNLSSAPGILTLLEGRWGHSSSTKNLRSLSLFYM